MILMRVPNNWKTGEINPYFLQLDYFPSIEYSVHSLRVHHAEDVGFYNGFNAHAQCHICMDPWMDIIIITWHSSQLPIQRKSRNHAAKVHTHLMSLEAVTYAIEGKQEGSA